MTYRNLILASMTAAVFAFVSCSGSSDTDSSNGGADIAESGRHPVVVLILDGVRADQLGSYGAAESSTPSLDEFASGAIQFDWAFAQAPDSASSMASFLTGLYPTTHGLVETDDRLVDEAGTLPEVLSGAGMKTAAFFTSGEELDERGMDQGFDLVEAGPQALEGALQWIEQNASSDFFLVVEVGSVDASAVGAEDAAGSYAAQVEALDSSAGRVLQALEGAGLTDKATIAVVALSGFEMGEHAGIGEPSIYSLETRVPMLLKSPHLPQGRSIDKIVEVIDLGPTLIELQGEESPVEFQGRSLVPLIEGSGTPPYVAFGEAAEEGEYYAALGGYRLVQRGADGPSELYDLATDPTEMTDLAASDENRVTVLEDHLGAWKKMVSAASLDPERRTEELDDEALEQLKSLGYIQ
jgi:arylsulfatase A-like enzyme